MRAAKAQKERGTTHGGVAETAGESVATGAAKLKKRKEESNKSDKQNHHNVSNNEKSSTKDQQQQQQQQLENPEACGAFDLFPISSSTIRLLQQNNIHRLLPSQFLTFKQVYEGCDVVCRAKTGTGKTLAFCLPLVEKHFVRDKNKNSDASGDEEETKKNNNSTGRLSAGSRKRGTPDLKVMVILPTRELAQQVHGEFVRLSGGRYTAVCVFGGAPESAQLIQIAKGCQVLVATPGRVLDFVERAAVTLQGVQAVVFDEADKLLEMGFREDMQKLLTTINQQKDTAAAAAGDSTGGEKGVKRYQLLLFTATFPKWARVIADEFMSPDRAFVDVTAYQQRQAEREKDTATDANDAAAACTPGGTGSGAGLIQHMAMQCHWKDRANALPLLLSLFCCPSSSPSAAGAAAAEEEKALCVIFCETKQEVNEVSLNSLISSCSCALHGDMSQQQREATLASFKKGKFQTLVATDVAARGLDVAGIRLVIQMAPPRDTETYIHRAGRTGRAGRKGVSVLFYNRQDAEFLTRIERVGSFCFKRIGFPSVGELKKQRLQQLTQQLFPEVDVAAAAAAAAAKAANAAAAGKTEEQILLQQIAKKVLKTEDPKDVVVRLLSCLAQDRHAAGGAAAGAATGSAATAGGSGVSPPPVSSLSGRSGFVSYCITFNPAPSPPLQGSCSYVWRALKNKFGQQTAAAAAAGRGGDSDVLERIEQMVLTEKGDGAVFDIPADAHAAWEEQVVGPLKAAAASGDRRKGFSIQLLSQLPPLQDALYLARQQQQQQQQQQRPSQSSASLRLNPNHVSNRRVDKKETDRGRGGRGAAAAARGRWPRDGQRQSGGDTNAAERYKRDRSDARENGGDRGFRGGRGGRQGSMKRQRVA
ncbi:nucleolar RNA helicase, putative [Eimeria mitis]|uniref:Nucleolar RNA helicase, putative n=1 Tax=Eimeria mitis TaxID=44415 RepID=U6KHD7_9EIME|nr:nucleolar RNA helicase, putative [Eimeria mitis]CDJ35692.1 nucleolar RNA helicase, putative [Eimeria mitis]